MFVYNGQSWISLPPKNFNYSSLWNRIFFLSGSSWMWQSISLRIDEYNELSLEQRFLLDFFFLCMYEWGMHGHGRNCCFSSIWWTKAVLWLVQWVPYAIAIHHSISPEKLINHEYHERNRCRRRRQHHSHLSHSSSGWPFVDFNKQNCRRPIIHNSVTCIVPLITCFN